MTTFYGKLLRYQLLHGPESDSLKSQRSFPARSNWEKEITRFAPSLRVTTFYGGNRKLQKIDTNTGALQAARAAGPDGAKKAREETAADVILTSYQVGSGADALRCACGVSQARPDRCGWWYTQKEMLSQ